MDYKDITMVLQLTLDRINLLNLHASHWTGPMSVTIYVGRKHLRDLGSVLSVMDSILQRNNIDFHIVLKEGVGVITYFIKQYQILIFFQIKKQRKIDLSLKKVKSFSYLKISWTHLCLLLSFADFLPSELFT